MSDMTMSNSASKAAAALRHLALNEDLKAYVLEEPRLYRVLLRATSRFIGGEEFSQCADVARDINQQGHAVTIDYMGESTRNEAIARQATDEFLKVVAGIEENKLNASVSLDLSHIGLAIDPELAFDHACQLASAARNVGLEMMISAEGLERTDAVLAMHEKLCQHFDNVGMTLQAYLYRSPKDLEVLLERPGKIRLVKEHLKPRPSLPNHGVTRSTRFIRSWPSGYLQASIPVPSPRTIQTCSSLSINSPRHWMSQQTPSNLKCYMA